MLRKGAPELAPLTRSAVLVNCKFGGPTALVVKFSTRADLLRAFALIPSHPAGRRPSAARDSWCLTGREAFTGGGLDPGDLPRFCARVHGTIRKQTAPDIPVPLPNAPGHTTANPPRDG